MLCFSLTENLRFSFANERLNIRRSTGRSCWCAQTKWNRVRDRRFSWKTRKNPGKICSTDKKLVFVSTWTIRSRYYLHRTRVKPNGKILMTHKVSHLNFFDLTDGERFFCIFPLIFVHFQWKLCFSSNSMKRIWKLHREYFYRQQINATLATEVKRSTNEKKSSMDAFSSSYQFYEKIAGEKESVSILQTSKRLVNRKNGYLSLRSERAFIGLVWNWKSFLLSIWFYCRRCRP